MHTLGLEIVRILGFYRFQVIKKIFAYITDNPLIQNLTVYICECTRTSEVGRF